MDHHPRSGRLLALVIALGLIAAACGDSSDSASGAEESAPETSESSAPGGDGISMTSTGQMLSLGEPQDGGEITIGTVTSFETLDYSVSSSTATGLIGRMVYETLLDLDENGEVVPSLAESMTSDDGVTWTMTLPEGVTFSDGTPLNATAVIEHLERLRSDESTSADKSDLARIASMETPDDLTIVFTVDAPWSSFGQVFAGSSGMIPSPAAVEAGGSQWGIDNPVGVGPYVVESFRPGAEAVLVKNEDYRIDGEPHIDRITLVPSLDSQARMAAIQAGDLDMTVSQSNVDWAPARDAGLTVLEQNSTTASNWVWNMTKPPYDDIRFREAAAHAIDIQAINEVVFEGDRQVMRGMLISEHPHFVDTDWPTFDPDRARALVDEYVADGGDPTFTVTVWGTPEFQRMGSLMQQMLADVGITMNTTTGDQATMITEAYEDYDSQLRYFGVNVGTDDSLYTQLHSGSRGNISKLNNPEMDALLEDMNATLDVAEKSSIYADIQHLTREEMPMVPLIRQSTGFVINDRFGGFPSSTPILVEYFDIRDVWVVE